MKRPPGIWLLLSAGVLWLSIQNVYGLKATSLIFGRTTTTTTTTEAASQDEASTATSVEENTIKSNLTGNPQLDYIYDPNLPRELNGYNLSSYPFFNSMPEDIDFKCDGLHDGFYASVPHKCQVYHHCLFGTRYDFLCANYTAFDQKTFICHFVSEVDCNNSRNYWHRNDALYEAASTTTVKPTPIVISPALTAAPRRPLPPVRRRKPLRRRPHYEYYDDEYDDDDREEDYEEPPPRRRRKRPRPRRPIYEDDYEEYEDDRYERRPSGRRNEDGNRKPYDRETDDRRDSDRKHEDRRNSSDRRADDEKRPSDDRRIKDDDRKSDDRKEVDDRRSGYDDRKSYDRRQPDDRRSDDGRKRYDARESDDRRYEDRASDTKRYKDDRRHGYDDRASIGKDEDEDFRYDRDRRKDGDRKQRPGDDYEDRRPIVEKRPSSDRRNEKRRPVDDLEPYDRPRKTHRRPYDDDLYEEDREGDSRVHSRPRKSDSRDDPPDDATPLVKPNSGGSVFNQPRMPPKIRPPVPKNEQNKFSFKSTTGKPVSKRPEDDEEYYEYEDEPPLKRTTTRSNRKPEPETSETRRPSKPSSSVERDERRDSRRPLGSASRPRAQMSRRPLVDPVNDDEDENPRSRPHTRPRHDLDSRDSRFNSNSRSRPPTDEDFSNSEKEDARTLSQKHSTSNKERTTSSPLPKFVSKDQRGRAEVRDKPKIETTRATTTTTTSTTTTTKEPPRQRSEPFVKVVKRPFLPSRGGNPYSARGLQPVGAKALESPRSSTPTQQEPDVSVRPTDSRDNLEPDSARSQQKPSPKDQPETSTSGIDEYDEVNPAFKINNENTEQNNDKSTTENAGAIKNGRQFPTSTESKTNTFLINEQPVDNYKRKPLLVETPPKQVYETSYEAKEPEPPEDKPFKPSPVLTKVPIRLKYSDPIDNEDEEEFHPVSNRPLSNLRQNGKPNAYQESRTTEKPIVLEKNPLDITENEYDVTLNDALNPTIPNLPIRNFPAGFNTATDYTFSSFHRPRYDVTLNQASETRYQVRAPSQRVETVAEPYVNRGENKYVNYNTQYNTPSADVYQNHNFRASPQITQAQTHAFYNVY